MSRLGYICDGCGDDHPRRDPPATVQHDGSWLDLCNGCYDLWEDEKETVLA